MEVFAKYMDIGHTVIHQIEWLRNNADKKLLRQLREGKIAIARAYHLAQGMSRISRPPRKEPARPKQCPQCSDKIRKAKLKLRKCHVHRWYCCKRCKWGI